jgi:REP element-mobilizing transposase RayT
MPRPPRLTAPSTVYHVILRCNAKEPLFRTRKDFESLLCILAHYKRKHGFKLHGYCIMHTHAHLVIQSPENEEISISQIMHDVASLYARDYNSRHERVGHFFGERFKSPIVEDDRYGIALLRYIAQNPVRAGLVAKPGDWQWSSYRFYESGEQDIFIDFLPSFEGLAKTRKRASQIFSRIVNEKIVTQDDGWTRNRVIGTETFIKRILGTPHDPLASGPPG